MSKRFSVALALLVVFGLATGQAFGRGGARGGARGSAGRPSGNVGGGNLGGGNIGGGGVGSQSRNFGGSPLGNNGAGQLGKSGVSALNGANVRQLNVPGGKQLNNFGAGQFRNSNFDNFGQARQATSAQSQVGAGQGRASQLQANFSSRNEPFSAGWYGDHPGAWQAMNPHADAWAAASMTGAWRWLGWGGAYGAYPTEEEDDSVYTSDVDNQDQQQPSDQTAQQAAPNADEANVSPQDAAALVARGAIDLPANTDFLPLGVYALAPAGQSDATAVVQISVSKDGILRGSYCDLVSDQGQTIYGAVDQKTQRAGLEGRRAGQGDLRYHVGQPHPAGRFGAGVLRQRRRPAVGLVAFRKPATADRCESVVAFSRNHGGKP